MVFMESQRKHLRRTPYETTSIGAKGIAQAESVMKMAEEPADFAGKVVELYNGSVECKAMCMAEMKLIEPSGT